MLHEEIKTLYLFLDKSLRIKVGRCNQNMFYKNYGRFTAVEILQKSLNELLLILHGSFEAAVSRIFI